MTPRNCSRAFCSFIMAYAISHSLPLLFSTARCSKPPDSKRIQPLPVGFFPPLRVQFPLRASRRSPSYHHDAVVVVPDPRAWIGDLGIEGDDDGDDESDEEEDDRSLDLLLQFLQSMFRKISRRARKAVRSVLPPTIPAKLVKFSVNGVLILAFLRIVKAFLEVICTLGTVVFVSVLLVRGVWSGVSFMKERHYRYMSRIDDDDGVWSHVQATT